MTKTTRILTTLLALTTLTACDGDRRDHAAERSEGTYRKAMADYQAGRLEESLKGFRAVVAADPANGSARFQYACLLQDFKQDAVEAAYAYHEFLQQNPSSEKVRLAQDRLATCERELVAKLSVKYALKGAESAHEVEVLRGEFKNAEERCRRLEKELATLNDQMRTLTEERDRLMQMIKGEGEGESTAAPSLKDAKALLDEDESESEGARAVKAVDRAQLAREAEEDLANASPLLPTQSPDAKEKRAAAEEARRNAERKDFGPTHPDSYVVQEGDTLYKIAVRFYGRSSAWQKIRDANKAVISTDGRVKTGVRIKLPK